MICGKKCQLLADLLWNVWMNFYKLLVGKMSQLVITYFLGSVTLVNSPHCTFCWQNWDYWLFTGIISIVAVFLYPVFGPANTQCIWPRVWLIGWWYRSMICDHGWNRIFFGYDIWCRWHRRLHSFPLPTGNNSCSRGVDKKFFLKSHQLLGQYVEWIHARAPA